MNMIDPGRINSELSLFFKRGAKFVVTQEFSYRSLPNVEFPTEYDVRIMVKGQEVSILRFESGLDLYGNLHWIVRAVELDFEIPFSFLEPITTLDQYFQYSGTFDLDLSRTIYLQRLKELSKKRQSKKINFTS